jgi:ribose/xylose/arabinose/galactoside ABC-type transport system permease subunit
MDGNDATDDPHTTALLGDSMYEKIRVQRYSLFKQSIPKTLAWQGVILSALALVLPLAASQPAATRVLLGGDPFAAAPKFLFLGAYAGAIEFVATLGLCYVAYRRLTVGEALTERQVHDLLAIEDAATNVGVITGGVAVAVVVALFLLGLSGEPFVGRFVDAIGRNPFEAGLIPVSVGDVAVAAAALAVGTFALSRVLARRLPE